MASSSDPDSCIPDALKDFVFDLHDSVRTSQIPSEQSNLYSGTFRELTAKYFEKSEWPSPKSVASECSNDELFLALYKELTQRHHHSISRPSIHERVAGWHVYRNLFDLILAEADKSSGGDNKDDDDKTGPAAVPEGDAFYILPEWCFDILHEFVYQFQGFCQFRTNTFANAAKHAPSSKDTSAADSSTSSSVNTKKKSPPNHLTESIEVLSKNVDAWAVETVLFYLHRLVQIGNESSVPAFSYLGLFASVTLSRLECLLGDYTASLSALAPAVDKKKSIAPPKGASAADSDESDMTSAEDVVHSVFAARLSVSYHAGVSYLMLRRYRDASKVLGDICATMQRGFKSGRYQKMAGSDQFGKLYDRMICLLAILTHVCPAPGLIDESVAQVVRDKHGSQLSKVEAGEEGYEEMFIFACPKFISPAVPQYDKAFTAGMSASSQDAYTLQVKHFMNEMASQQTMRKLRSYMKLYTSISVEKLGRLVFEKDFLALLLSYKHKMRQIEAASEDGVEATLDGKVGTITDIHYYIKDDIIHVDEAEKQNRFENYFMSQISQCSDIISNVESLSVNI